MNDQNNGLDRDQSLTMTTSSSSSSKHYNETKTAVVCQFYGKISSRRKMGKQLLFWNMTITATQLSRLKKQGQGGKGNDVVFDDNSNTTTSTTPSKNDCGTAVVQIMYDGAIQTQQRKTTPKNHKVDHCSPLTLPMNNKDNTLINNKDCGDNDDDKQYQSQQRIKKLHHPPLSQQMIDLLRVGTVVHLECIRSFQNNKNNDDDDHKSDRQSQHQQEKSTSTTKMTMEFRLKQILFIESIPPTVEVMSKILSYFDNHLKATEDDCCEHQYYDTTDMTEDDAMRLLDIKSKEELWELIYLHCKVTTMNNAHDDEAMIINKNKYKRRVKHQCQIMNSRTRDATKTKRDSGRQRKPGWRTYKKDVAKLKEIIDKFQYWMKTTTTTTTTTTPTLVVDVSSEITTTENGERIDKIVGAEYFEGDNAEGHCLNCSGVINAACGSTYAPSDSITTNNNNEHDYYSHHHDDITTTSHHPMIHPIHNLYKYDEHNTSRRGHQSMGDYAKYKKSPQTQWFVQRIKELLADRRVHWTSPSSSYDSTSSASTTQQQLHILDVGGGRGDLTFALLDGLTRTTTTRTADTTTYDDENGIRSDTLLNLPPIQVHITVVDTNKSSLDWCGRQAKQLGLLHCITVKCCSITDILSDNDFTSTLDIIVGLHTCGGLTDASLNIVIKAAQVQWQKRKQAAKERPLDTDKPPPRKKSIIFLINPCCFRRHINLRPPFPLGWTTRMTITDDDDDVSKQQQEQQEQAVNHPCSVRHFFFNQDEIDLLTKLAESSHRSLSLQSMKCINLQRLLRFDYVIRQLCGGRCGEKQHDILNNASENSSTNHPSCGSRIQLEWIQMNSYDKKYSLRNLVLEGHVTIM